MPRRVCLSFVSLLLVAGAGWSRSEAADGRLVAIADIHGAYKEFVEILQAAELTNQRNEWIGGKSTLVQTGDFLDRGAAVRKTMDLLRSLQRQAAAAGGEVVVMLGNHEAMNLLGFQSDVNPEAYAGFANADSEARVVAESRRYGKWLKRRAKQRKERPPAYGEEQQREFIAEHPPGYFEYLEALRRDGEYGAWLRSLPMVVERQHIVFLHGGISPKYIGWSIDELNDRMSQEIDLLDACRTRLLADGVIFETSDPNEMVSEGLAELAFLTNRITTAPAALRARLVDSLRILQGCVGYEDWFLIKNDSPIWYRGYARLDPEEMLEVVVGGLEGLGANRFVVGHTPQKTGRVERRLDGRVFLADTGMLTRVYHGRPAALEFVDGAVYAIYVGERVLLEESPLRQETLSNEERPETKAATPADPSAVPGSDTTGERPVRGMPPGEVSAEEDEDHPPGAGEQTPAETVVEGREQDPSAFSVGAVGTPVGWSQVGRAGVSEGLPPGFVDESGNPLPFASEGELVAFLVRGEVELLGVTDTGINRPHRAKVRADDITVDAVFRSADSVEERFHTKQGHVLPVLRDSYRYEPAAYRLSVAFGLNRVPPAVLRTVDGKPGSLQLWMHGLVSEKARLERGFRPTDRPGWRRQIAEHKLFDRLIGNVDRNQGNLLIDLESEKIWLIDHSRAFVEVGEPADLNMITRCPRSMYEFLHSADEPQARSLMQPYLLKGEMDALWSRWRSVADRLGQLVQEYGEDQILY